MRQLSFSTVMNAVERCGHVFFDRGDYNLNLVGIRSADTDSNAFNDALCVLFYTAGRPHIFMFEATTDPGTYWRKNPCNIEGTAIVVPGQYRGVWAIGKHQGRYVALTQQKPLTVYRDNNCDNALNTDAYIETGHFGINCHHANPQHKSKEVDKWSAGCQVLASPVDFQLLMALCMKASEEHGNSFTYTLINESDLL